MIFFNTPVTKTGASPGVWNTTSLSGDIPTWARSVVIMVGSASGGARKPGETMTPTINVIYTCTIVETDSSRQVDLYSNGTHYILGYGEPGEVGTVPTYDSLAPTPGSWQTSDLSSLIPATATGVIIRAVDAGGGGVGARYPSMGVDIYGTWTINDEAVLIAGVNSSRVVELYRAAGTVTFNLMGYLTSLSFLQDASPVVVTFYTAGWTDVVAAGYSGEVLWLPTDTAFDKGARIDGWAVTPLANAAMHQVVGQLGRSTIETNAIGGADESGRRIGRFKGYRISSPTETVTLTDAVTNTPTSGAAGTLYPHGRVGKLYLVKGGLER